MVGGGALKATRGRGGSPSLCVPGGAAGVGADAGGCRRRRLRAALDGLGGPNGLFLVFFCFFGAMNILELFYLEPHLNLR